MATNFNSLGMSSSKSSTCRRCWDALFGLIFLLLLPPFAWGADDLRVLVVLSESLAPYQTFAKAFQQNLSANIKVSVLERPESFSDNDQATDLIITVGIGAADWAMGRATKPVLAVMIPSSKYADLLEKRTRPKQISAIYIDQPWLRQMALLRAALP